MSTDTIITLKVSKSMFRGGDIRLPKSLDHIFGAEKMKTKMIFDDEAYDMTIQASRNLFIYGFSDYRLKTGAAFARKSRVFFAYTYAVTAFRKDVEHEESITLSIYKDDDTIYLKEIGHVVYEDEHTPFLRSSISRGIIDDDFRTHEEMEIEEVESIDGLKSSKKTDRSVILNLKKASDLVPNFSSMIPIEDLDKHICVKRCIYMWFSQDSKRMYIGSAKTLQSRLVQHRDNTDNEKICIEKYGSSFKITHFAYLEFRPVVPMIIVRAIEKDTYQVLLVILAES